MSSVLVCLYIYRNKGPQSDLGTSWGRGSFLRLWAHAKLPYVRTLVVTMSMAYCSLFYKGELPFRNLFGRLQYFKAT